MVATPVDRRPGRPGRVQLIAIELAAIAVGATVYAGAPIATAVAGAAALLLLAVACGRSQGRWVYEAVAARRGLRQRRRAAMLASRVADPPGTASTGVIRPLAALAPHLSVRAVTDRGTAIGVGQDDLGWFAAIVVAPWTGLSGERAAALPVDRLAKLVTEASVPVSAVQVVTHVVPAPSAGVHGQSACALSYHELLAGRPDVAEQEMWVAVRLAPRDGAPAAATRGGGLAGVDRALAATLARVGTVLTTSGVDHRILDADGLRQALTIACGLQRLAGGMEPVAERWTCWEAAGVVHVSFAVHGWPPQPPPGLLGALGQVPGATAVDTALLLRSVDGAENDLAVRVVVRLAAAPEHVDGCVQELQATAGRLGVRLTRLDGEHAAGVYATAPTGLALGASPW